MKKFATALVMSTMFWGGAAFAQDRLADCAAALKPELPEAQAALAGELCKRADDDLATASNSPQRLAQCIEELGPNATDPAKVQELCQSMKTEQAPLPQVTERARFFLGGSYAAGRDALEEDQLKAATLIRQAAEAGDAKAAFGLAVLYEKGLAGLPRDAAKAAEFYKTAAADGNAGAQARIGVLYAEGRGVAQDDATAVQLFLAAEPKEDRLALLMLGKMYAEGRGGLPKDAEKAAKYQKMAANAYETASAYGDRAAQVDLAMLHLGGEPGFAKDDVVVVELLQLSADMKSVIAQNLLGEMHEQGRGGLAKDGGMAAELYRKAAERGFIDAEYNLGRMLIEGEGVHHNPEEARDWLKKAADQGSTEAAAMLAKLPPN